MNVIQNNFPGLLIIKPTMHRDERGYFYESWHEDRYQKFGIFERFVQDNRSMSKKNVIRGLHYQIQRPQGQLIYLTEGRVFDVAVDLRMNSPTFKQIFTITLDSNVPTQVYMPPGFAHGFCVLTETAAIHYKCTDYYDASDEGGLLWNDLEIPWPNHAPIMSKKDQELPTLNQILAQDLLPKMAFN